MRLPEAEEPELLLKSTEVADTPAAIVKSTYATAPSEIGVAFIPKARHVKVPRLAKQLSVLPTAVAAGPEVTDMAVTSLGEYVRVHWTPTGMWPLSEVRFRFRETVPSDAALPEDRVKESVCPNDTFAATKNAAVSKGAMLLFLKKSSLCS
jgi:hypothetical protein